MLAVCIIACLCVCFWRCVPAASPSSGWFVMLRVGVMFSGWGGNRCRLPSVCTDNMRWYEARVRACPPLALSLAARPITWRVIHIHREITLSLWTAGYCLTDRMRALGFSSAHNGIKTHRFTTGLIVLVRIPAAFLSPTQCTWVNLITADIVPQMYCLKFSPPSW